MRNGKALRGPGDTQPKLWEEIVGLLEYPHIDYSWIPFLRLWGTSFSWDLYIHSSLSPKIFLSRPSLLCPRQKYHNRPGDAFSGQRGHPPSVDSSNFRSWELRGYSTVSMTWELVKRLKKIHSTTWHRKLCEIQAVTWRLVERKEFPWKKVS